MAESEPKKRTRKMTDEMLAKLAVARQRAMEVKKKLKEGGDSVKIEHLQERIEKVKST